MHRSLNVLRSGSPLVGILGAIVVVALLFVFAYAFRSPSNGTPAASGSVGAPTGLPGAQPAPK
jgi:hypothetical protein